MADGLILHQSDAFRLRLSSRAGVPDFIEVELGRSVYPFFPCGEYEVRMVAGDDGRLLDRQTVVLSKWEKPWDNLVSHYECYGYANLHFNGYAGPVEFGLFEPDTERVYFQTLPFPILGLPAGAAVDENMTFGGGLLAGLEGLTGLVKWSVIGTLVVGAAYFGGPILRELAERFDEEA